MSGQATRGSALPETALVMTVILGMVLGIIQIGVIGFLQIMCDGAAFIAAHEYSLGNASYAALAARPFPLMGTPSPTPNPPDALSSVMPVVYGGGGGATAREGGVSILMPNHAQVTVNIPSSAVLGSGFAALSHINLHGTAIEPNYLVSYRAYNIAGASYAGNAAGTPFFGSTEDTPDYYVSSHRMLVCAAAFSKGAWTASCPADKLRLRSLGTAEFLDVDNWARTASNTSSAGVGPGTSYTFAEIYCHVNAYIAAAQVFQPAATINDMPSGGGSMNPPSGTQGTSTIYSWDGNGGGSFANGASSVESPGQYPLNPNAGC